MALCEDTCNYVNWDNVVGPLVDENDVTKGRNYALGHVHDLLEIARDQLNKAKGQGQLTAKEMGQAYAATIPAAFREAINYELAEREAEVKVEQLKEEVRILKNKT